MYPKKDRCRYTHHHALLNKVVYLLGCPSGCKCEEIGKDPNKKILVTGEDLRAVPSNLPSQTGAVYVKRSFVEKENRNLLFSSFVCVFPGALSAISVRYFTWKKKLKKINADVIPEKNILKRPTFVRMNVSIFSNNCIFYVIYLMLTLLQGFSNKTGYPGCERRTLQIS